MRDSKPHPDLDTEPDWRSWAFVGGAFLGLNALLHLPPLLLGTVPSDPVFYLQHPPRLYYLFSLDLFGLVCLLALVPYIEERGWLRPIVAGSILFLFAYQIYDAAIGTMLHRSPIFYADVPHVVGAVYLLLNAGVPWVHILGLGAGVGALVGLGWGLPILLRRLHRSLRRPSVRGGVLIVAVGLGGCVTFAVAMDRGIRRTTYQSICLSTTECVVHNVQASITLGRDLGRRRSQPADSTYLRYDDVQWEHPPSIYLVMIESYGSVLATPPHRTAYQRLMGDVADSLAVSGWHAASAQSEAPVFGGLSWLSAATLLLGTPVEHQPTFDVVRATLSRYPHLVRTLKRRGYTTGTLQPPVRSRPGLSVDNPYDFDRTLYFDDLDYDGPEYGWGIVPDQYSLAAAHEHFVGPAEAPFFLFFETVTTHSPWDRAPPPIVDDPAALERIDPSARTAQRATASIEQLFEHVKYDWRVLANYLRTQAPPNSLVVIAGDHQPYFAEGTSFATPLHVLSRDEQLVRRFETYGLTPGLRPAPAADTLHHAGLYSMILRTLTAHDRAESEASVEPLPPYHPQGVTQSALLSD